MNLMEEKEAKTKWCPMARVAAACGAAVVAVNIEPSVNQHREPCIGGKCMMWRWAVMRDDPLTGDKLVSKTHGYCGLAGDPQELKT